MELQREAFALCQRLNPGPRPEVVVTLPADAAQVFEEERLYVLNRMQAWAVNTIRQQVGRARVVRLMVPRRLGNTHIMAQFAAWLDTDVDYLCPVASWAAIVARMTVVSWTLETRTMNRETTVCEVENDEKTHTVHLQRLEPDNLRYASAAIVLVEHALPPPDSILWKSEQTLVIADYHYELPLDLVTLEHVSTERLTYRRQDAEDAIVSFRVEVYTRNATE